MGRRRRRKEGGGRRERKMEQERRVAYVYLHDVHVLFSSLPFGSRGLRAQRLLSRKKAISIFGTKEFFFFFRERGISILEYVLGTSRMGINWKTSYPRWKNNFYVVLEDNSIRMNFVETFPSLRSRRSL